MAKARPRPLDPARELSGKAPILTLIWINYMYRHVYNAFVIVYPMTLNVDLIGDPTRRSILALLGIEGEVCVCEFVAALDEVQPSISRHLALLRAGGWLTSRREGTWIHYRLANLPQWASDLVDALIDGGVPKEVLRAARRRLGAFQGRPVRDAERAA